MLLCPQCNKPVAEKQRHCSTCRADLDLLVDYVSRLEVVLKQAERYTRAGDLDQAVWSYLEVLEIDPDNAKARAQVGRVATAVRQFDRVAPGRRWIAAERGELLEDTANHLTRWLRVALVVLVVLTAFGLGYTWGNTNDTKPTQTPPRELREQHKPATLGN